MAAPLHQRQAAAGVPHRQEQLQLLLQRWRHQIQAAAHQQGGHPQIAQTPLGPQQRAETVEQHHPPQLRRARQGRRQRRRRQLTLQQQRQVGNGQSLHRPRTTAVQARLRLQARRHQGGDTPQRMAQQHHPIPLHRQPTGPLGRQQSLDIRQALSQHLRPRRRPLPGQAGFEGRRVAAGMLQRHRGPTPLGQGASQPAQLVGIAPQPRQQQHPGPLGPPWLRRRPDLHRQGIAAMGHHQVEALQMGRGAIRLVQRGGPAWGQSHQSQIG